MTRSVASEDTVQQPGALPAGGDAFRAALDAARTQDGESLLALSERAPLLVVFLRHFG